MKRGVCALFGALLSCLVLGQAIEYPVFETDKLPVAENRQHRLRLMEQMGAGSIGVFFTNPTAVRNNDVDFMFRGDSDFLYLTGMEEPNTALILIPGGVVLDGKKVDEILFCNNPRPSDLTWVGYFMGPTNAMRLLVIGHALQTDQFQKTLQDVVAASGAKRLFTTNTLATDTAMPNQFAAWQKTSGLQAMSAEPILGRMREVKSAEEIRLLRRAVDASVKGHIEAMKAAKANMWEYQIAALVKYVFEINGCEFYGYPPIVGSGPNSTILHYETNRRQMRDGDMICMDTAGEFHGYSADVTRSFPVNGKFTPEQRSIYQVVLAAADAGFAAVKVDGQKGLVTEAIDKVLIDGLTSLGIIKDRSELGRYYMHGWGHGIGLDVHDPWPSPTFLVGSAFTIEPGIYIKAGSPCDPKWWNIGVRIEDDILITPGGAENMSANCPRTIADIERTMAQSSAIVGG